MSAPSNFTGNALLQAASERCGLANFGDDNYRPALEKFVHSCRNDGYVSEAGFPLIGETLVGILVNRLQFEDDLIKHPEILDEEIVSPLIIIGAGRVGSTKMHRLLANATNIQSFPFWQLKNPGRFPDAEKGKPDPRIAPTAALCLQIESNLPQLFAAIEPVAQEPDEDVHVLDLTFMQFYFCALAYTPSYLDWILEQDWREPYRYFKKILQYLQWQNGAPGKPRNPMLLKGPFHTIYMDIVNDLLPRAKFVQLHRDPVTCAASLAKITHLLQQLNHGQATLEHNGYLLENYITHKLLENLRVRERRPDIPVADFYYEQVRDDAVGLAQNIFDFWKVPLSAQSRQLMDDWEIKNSQHKYGKFDYTVEETGIDRARMEANMGAYMQRFYPGKG